MSSLNIKKPELLSPAGSWPALLSAIENGADSVYFGIKGMNMRASASNFELSEMKRIMSLLHGQGKKGYLTLNTIIMNDQMEIVERILQKAKETNVDAVILWDMGVFHVARQMDMAVHLSTQASTANIQAIQFYHRMGVKQNFLSPKFTLQQIQEIKQGLKEKHIDCELEVFIHGAMCLSISGRCFMSQYVHGRSANQGECTQPCRREYEIKAVKGDEHFIVGRDYVMSPKDLCAIDFIEDLIEAGIDSFKIEGRTRSPEYCAVVTFVYRKAIDAYYEGRLDQGLKEDMKQILKMVYNRGFSDGFYFGEPKEEKSRMLEHTHEKIFIGEVKKYYKTIQVADVFICNEGLRKGGEILIFGKQTPASYVTIHEMQQDHRFVDHVGSRQHVGVKIPFEVKKGDKVFLWRKRVV